VRVGNPKISGLLAPFQTRFISFTASGRPGRFHPNPRWLVQPPPRPAALGCIPRRLAGSEFLITYYPFSAQACNVPTCVSSADEREAGVSFHRGLTLRQPARWTQDQLPLTWYPTLLEATAGQRNNSKLAGGGYGIDWPDLDEDLSTEGLLRRAPAPRPKTTA